MWVPTSRDNIPYGAVVGGYDRNENLYVCQVKRNKNLVIPGKVAALYNACFIAYLGKEIHYRDYDILIVPNTNTYGEHENFMSNFELQGRDDQDADFHSDIEESEDLEYADYN